MPGMDGEQLGRKIQQDPDLKAAHLVMLTSLGQLRDAIQLRELGIAACLTKPVRAKRLKSLVETLLIDGPTTEALQEAEAAAAPSADGDLSGLRVLVAEDNPTNLLVVVKLLRKLQIEPTTVTDGRAALEALRAGTFDLILNGYPDAEHGWIRSDPMDPRGRSHRAGPADSDRRADRSCHARGTGMPVSRPA